MRAILWLLLWAAGAGDVFAIEFDRYHRQDEINAFMRELAAANPQLVRFHQLGYSEGGREIDYVVVTKGDPDALPAIYMNGTHHGNEKSSTEGILALIDHLVTNRNDPAVSSLLDNYAIYLQPLVNPDGHAANTREDQRGHDPNRDYAFPERGDEDSFKTPQIRLVKELADKVKFRAASAWHSGMEAVLWPWCYTPQRPNEADTFYTLSKIAAEAMSMRQYGQSYNDYPSRGEFIDYVYMAHNTLAVTFEVSTAGNPPASQLASVVRRATAGGMAFMRAVQRLDEGTLEMRHAPDGPAPAPMSLVSSPVATAPVARGE